MAKVKRNLTLDEHAAAALDRVGNASEYLSRLISSQWAVTQHALGVLERAGISTHEMRVACQDLIGSNSFLTCARIVAELGNVPRLAKRAKDSEEICVAISTIAREFWLGNKSLRERLTST